LIVGALEQDPTVADDPERLTELLTSNLCRCTGYAAIRRAVESAQSVPRLGTNLGQSGRFVPGTDG